METSVSTEQKKELYYEMFRIRLIEESLIRFHDSGSLRSVTHLSIGQEAVAVGVCTALLIDDLAVSTHRCHAHYLAKGGNLKQMISELAGKDTGCGGGRAGSMLLFDKQAGLALSSALVAGSIPIAVGLAAALAMDEQKSIVVAFFGDGAVEEGVFWESLNFAVLYRLPILFVCENNLYATHSHIKNRQPSENITERIVGFGLPTIAVDGNDAVEVYSTTRNLVFEIRGGNGPAFMEAKTYRWMEHWGTKEDWSLGYRSREEGDAWKRKCPLKNLETFLRSEVPGLYEWISECEKHIYQEIGEAWTYARESSIGPLELKETT